MKRCRSGVVSNGETENSDFNFFLLLLESEIRTKIKNKEMKEESDDEIRYLCSWNGMELIEEIENDVYV